jgi:hypothetical protein
MASVITFPPFPPGGPGPLQGLRGLRFRGTWNPQTAYAVDDGVYFNGSSYIAIAINVGNQPDVSPATWQIIALGAASTAVTVTDTLSSIVAAQGSIIYKLNNQPTGWAALPPGIAGQILQTPGLNQSPIWATLTATQSLTAVQQSSTTTTTYTPTPGMKVSIHETWAGGGGGGGAANSAVGQSTGGFGGSGGYSRRILTALQIGTGQMIIIGPGGLGGLAGNNPGNPGGDTTVGTVLCVAKGGSPGLGAAANSNAPGGLGGIPGTGDEAHPGSPGDTGAFSSESPVVIPIGRGGDTSLGRGGLPGASPTDANCGAGGGAGLSTNNNGDQPGAQGSNGFWRVTEFIFS